MRSDAIKPNRNIVKDLNCWSMLLTTLSECDDSRQACPTHQGQEKAENEKFAHKQMLVRNEAFGIHRAVGRAFIRQG
jgi:epoxyqueuosine reductase QueG